MDTFVKLRHMLRSHEELMNKLKELERTYDKQFQIVFEAIRELMELPEQDERQIGFRASRRSSEVKP